MTRLLRYVSGLLTIVFLCVTTMGFFSVPVFASVEITSARFATALAPTATAATSVTFVYPDIPSDIDLTSGSYIEMTIPDEIVINYNTDTFITDVVFGGSGTLANGTQMWDSARRMIRYTLGTGDGVTRDQTISISFASGFLTAPVAAGEYVLGLRAVSNADVLLFTGHALLAVRNSNNVGAGIVVAPPQDVSVTNAGNGTATVSWRLPPYTSDIFDASVDGFIIQKKKTGADDSTYTQAGVYYSSTGTSSSTNVSYAVTGLTEDTYDFRVLTLSKFFDAQSNPIQSRTDCTADSGDVFRCKATNAYISAAALAPPSGGSTSASVSTPSVSVVDPVSVPPVSTPPPAVVSPPPVVVNPIVSPPIVLPEPVSPLPPADTTLPIVTSVSTNTPSGERMIGDAIVFTLTFSEPVTSSTGLTIQLDNGARVGIPAWSGQQTNVSATYVVSTWDTTNQLTVLFTEGRITDAASNVTINPVPQKNLTPTITIRGVSLTVVDPALVNGQYVTTIDVIRLLPVAPGATMMRVNTAGLKVSDVRNSVALNTWTPYTGSECTLVLSAELGARSVVIDFKNASGATRSVSAVIARLGTTEEVLVEKQQVAEKVIVAQQTVIEATTKILNTEETTVRVDLASVPPVLLGALTDAAQSGDAQKIESEKVKLTETLTQVSDFRTLLTSGKTDELISSLVEFLGTHSDATLNTILTTDEINRILSVASNTDSEMLLPYLDQKMAVVHTDVATQKVAIVEQPLSVKDSDGDGLSDLLETNTYHTNPYLSDTDSDGISDGSEVLDLGTDPLDPNDPNDDTLPTRFTNVKDDQIFTDPTPVLRGTAPQGAHVTVVAVAVDGSVIPLGTTVADAEKKWLFVPTSGLTDGTYRLEIHDADEVTHDARNVAVNLSFILPPPSLVSTNSGDITMDGPLVFSDNQPVFYGNTYYGSTIVASFQSLLMSTSIIADNPEGDFEISPPKELESGDHTLTLYAELPDGTRSAPHVIHFAVDSEKQAMRHEASVWRSSVVSSKNVILALLLINVGILLYELWRENRKRRPKESTVR